MNEDAIEDAEPKQVKRGVGVIAEEAIRAGLTNEEALANVLAELPNQKTSIASINWYRNKLRADDKSVPTSRQLKRAAAKAAAKAAEEAEEIDPLE